MNRKLILICSFVLLILSVVGCSFSKEDVTLLNQNQATRYAKSHFGEAAYKETESQTDDRIDYIFIDKEYNFEYKICSCKREKINLGGEYSGFYTETTESNFGGKYYDYIIASLSEQVLELEQKYNISIKSNDGWKDIYSYIESNNYIARASSQTAFYSIYSNNYETKMKAGNELASLVKAIDNRKYFKTCSIWIRENDINSNGVYARIESISLD